MDPKLLEILKKSKQIEKATNAKYGKSGSHGNSGGLYDQIDGGSLVTAEQAASMGANMVMETSSPVATRVDVNSDRYEELVDNSNLPPAVAAAMKKNPIPQPNMPTDVSAEDIKALREESYSDGDEHDFMKETRHRATPTNTVNQQITDNVSNLSESQIRKMIGEELAKVLPRIVENYFDKKVIKENMKVMKYVIKNSQTKKRIQ